MRAYIPLGLAIGISVFLAISGEWIGLGIFFFAMGLTIGVLHLLNKE
jgi:hypothetical protein